MANHSSISQSKTAATKSANALPNQVRERSQCAEDEDEDDTMEIVKDWEHFNSTTKRKRMPQIQVFVEMADAKRIKLKVGDAISISELKRKLCSDYGIMLHNHHSLTFRGMPLEDVLTLPDVGIKKDSTLHSTARVWKSLEKKALGKSCSGPPVVADAEAEEDDENDKFDSEPGVLAREETLDEACSRRTSLANAMTSGGFVRDLSPSKTNSREAARTRAQEKATIRHHRRLEKEMTLFSKLTHYLFPDMFVRCVPMRGA